MSFVYVLAVLLALSIGRTRSASPNYEELSLKWQVSERMTALRPELLLRAFFQNYGLGDRPKLNEGCHGDLRRLEEDLKIRRPWALKMLDASSTVSSGVYKGNFVDLGMFDECLAINENEEGGIKARHCMYTIGAQKQEDIVYPVYPTMSICLPTSCDKDDVELLLHGLIQSNETSRKELKIRSTSCTSNEPRLKDTAFWISITFLAIFIGVAVSGTVCDLWNRCLGSDEAISGTMCKFSALKSAKKILSTETPESDIRSIHGMRVISIAWVVLVHEYFMPMFAPNVNSVDFNEWLGTWPSIFALTGISCVDTFFVMSGFLTTYNFFKKRLYGDESFHVLQFYAHRYLRLTPPIAAIVAISFIILVYPMSGALYEWIESIGIAGCRTKWWTFLTYTSNLIESSNYALGYLWFLAVDMQLFFISPIILYPLSKNPRVGLTILLSLFLVSIASTAAIVGFNKFSAVYFDHSANIHQVLREFREVYIMPHTRASTWLLGVGLGYKMTHEHEKPSKLGITAGWLLTIFFFGFGILGMRSFLIADYDYNVTYEVIFAAISRPMWGICICWLIYSTYHGYAGPVATFLSWRGFVPLSKLSFCVYLVHFLNPFVRVATTRTNVFFSDFILFHAFIADMVLSLVLAFLLAITFEVPMQVLDGLLFKRRKK